MASLFLKLFPHHVLQVECCCCGAGGGVEGGVEGAPEVTCISHSLQLLHAFQLHTIAVPLD